MSSQPHPLRKKSVFLPSLRSRFKPTTLVNHLPQWGPWDIRQGALRRYKMLNLFWAEVAMSTPSVSMGCPPTAAPWPYLPPLAWVDTWGSV